MAQPNDLLLIFGDNIDPLLEADHLFRPRPGRGRAHLSAKPSEPVPLDDLPPLDGFGELPRRRPADPRRARRAPRPRPRGSRLAAPMSGRPPLVWRDSRRLTGPNLLLDGPGAVLEASLARGPRGRAGRRAGRRRPGPCSPRSAGRAAPLAVRRFPGGASFAVAAPLDGLYAATLIVEWACDARAPGRYRPAPLATAAPRSSARSRPTATRSLWPWPLRPHSHGSPASRATARSRSGWAPVAWSGRRPAARARGARLGRGPRRAGDPGHRHQRQIHHRPPARRHRPRRRQDRGPQLQRLGPGRRRDPGPGRLFRPGRRTPRPARPSGRDRGAGARARRHPAPRPAAGPRHAALVTNVAADHLGEYGILDVDGIADTKLVVAKALRMAAALIVNADDPRLAERAPATGAPLAWFSMAPAPVDPRRRRARGRHDSSCARADGRSRSCRPRGPHRHGRRRPPQHRQRAGRRRRCRDPGPALAAMAEALRSFGADEADNPGRGMLARSPASRCWSTSPTIPTASPP